MGRYQGDSRARCTAVRDQLKEFDDFETFEQKIIVAACRKSLLILLEVEKYCYWYQRMIAVASRENDVLESVRSFLVDLVHPEYADEDMTTCTGFVYCTSDLGILYGSVKKLREMNPDVPAIKFHQRPVFNY